MDISPRDNYLSAEILTAPQEKLHLLLIEAALRCCHRAKQHWLAGQEIQATEALIRAQEIAAEMLAGLKREAAPELVAQVAAVYGFVYRSLVEAGLLHDEAKLGGAIRVLEIERETWRQLCDRLSGKDAGQSAKAPPMPHFQSPTAAAAPGFSLDA